MHDDPIPASQFSSERRDVLGLAASLGVAGLGLSLSTGAAAQSIDLAPYTKAKVNWKQVEGESISVA
ncbi:MAG: hypothetical protein EBT08_03490, partial [Betaproteobacteria bacterium]|nr:hypothetical protein [Betaproteobacteria bacterium]